MAEAHDAPPPAPPDGAKHRAAISSKYSELNAEEARVAVAVKQETVIREFDRDVAPVTTRVASVPLDAVQFVSERRSDERHQQAVSSAQEHAAANAAIRRLEATALARVRGQNSDTAKKLGGLETAVRRRQCPATSSSMLSARQAGGASWPVLARVWLLLLSSSH